MLEACFRILRDGVEVAIEGVAVTVEMEDDLEVLFVLAEVRTRVEVCASGFRLGRGVLSDDPTVAIRRPKPQREGGVIEVLTSSDSSSWPSVR